MLFSGAFIPSDHHRSMIERMADGEFYTDKHAVMQLNEAFGDIEVNHYWNRWAYEGDRAEGDAKIEAIDRTIALMQEKYPLQATGDYRYLTTPSSVTLCDYDDAWEYLPKGKDDRRYKEDFPLGQVFEYDDKNDKRHTVIAFTRESLAKPNSLKDAIDERARDIAEGRAVFDLGSSAPEAVAIHEYGHAYAKHMDNAFIHSSETAKEYWEWFKTLTKDEIRLGISDYAATNRGEFEAECFLEMQFPNPRPLAVKWWSFMQKIHEEGF